MLKTLFIILISVTASAITTASLLYRYTVPIETLPAQTVAAQPVEPAYASGQPGPVEILDEYVNLQTDLPPQNTAVDPGQTDEIKVSTPVKANATDAQSQRGFNHKLLMSDISALSNKLERFNDFLSNEVKRLKDGGSEEKQP